jgi:hypothetical protein
MSQKYFLRGLRDLRGSKYKQPANATDHGPEDKDRGLECFAHGIEVISRWTHRPGPKGQSTGLCNRVIPGILLFTDSTRKDINTDPGFSSFPRLTPACFAGNIESFQTELLQPRAFVMQTPNAVIFKHFC